MEVHDSAQADHVCMILFDELPYNVVSERGDWFLRVPKDDPTPKEGMWAQRLSIGIPLTLE